MRVLCGVYICAAEFVRLQATACGSGVGGESAGLRRSVRGAVGLSLCGAGLHPVSVTCCYECVGEVGPCDHSY